MRRMAFTRYYKIPSLTHIKEKRLELLIINEKKASFSLLKIEYCNSGFYHSIYFSHMTIGIDLIVGSKAKYLIESVSKFISGIGRDEAISGDFQSIHFS